MADQSGLIISMAGPCVCRFSFLAEMVPSECTCERLSSSLRAALWFRAFFLQLRASLGDVFCCVRCSCPDGRGKEPNGKESGRLCGRGKSKTTGRKTTKGKLTSFASRRQARIATRAGVHVSLFFRDCAHTAGYTRQGPRRKGGDPPPLPSLPFRRAPHPHCRTRGPLA